MKKALVIFSTLILLQSCATVLGGKVTDCQRTKPEAGQPKRKVRVGVVVADVVLFAPGVFIDLATGAIYKPCK